MTYVIPPFSSDSLSAACKLCSKVGMKDLEPLEKEIEMTSYVQKIFCFITRCGSASRLGWTR